MKTDSLELKRIGLFGGTFNPVHLGHLRVALEVKEAFDLSQVLLIPSAHPPHKEANGLTKAADRMEMIRLAAGDRKDFLLSDVELLRTGRSYTVDTIRTLMDSAKELTLFHLIVGMDAFLEIHSWKSFGKILELTPIIVMVRPGSLGRGASPTETLRSYLHERISPKYVQESERATFTHPDLQPVHVFETTQLDISSTKIRELVRNGRSIRFLVPEKVEDFIKAKGLYL